MIIRSNIGIILRIGYAPALGGSNNPDSIIFSSFAVRFVINSPGMVLIDFPELIFL
jgi:hypothetical protein